MSCTVVRTLLLSIFFVCSIASAQEEEPSPYVPNDFDGDGVSDVALSENQSDGSPNELVYEYTESDSGADERIEFGSAADLFAQGDYDGDGITEPAYVRSESGALLWRYQSSVSNSVETISFGEEGNGIVTGCDVDHDGRTDPMVLAGSTIQALLSGTEETLSVALALPENATITDILCRSNSEDGTELAVYLLTGSSSGGGEGGEGGGGNSGTSCKQQYPKSSGMTKKQKRKRRRKIRKCKRAKKAGTSAFSSQAYINAYSLVDGSEVESHAVGGKVEGMTVGDFDNDGTEDLAYFQKVNKQVTRISFFVGANAVPIDLPKFSEITVGRYLDASNVGRPGAILRQGSSLYRFFFDQHEVQEFSSFLSGDDLLRSTHVKMPLPEGISSLCPDGIMDARDGTAGDSFLFKHSENGGTVSLLPTRYSRVASWARLFDALGTQVADLYYTGKANGNRQHWRHRTNPTDFADDLYYIANIGGSNVCWSLGKMSNRID